MSRQRSLRDVEPCRTGREETQPWSAFFLVMAPFWVLLVSGLWFTRK